MPGVPYSNCAVHSVVFLHLLLAPGRTVCTHPTHSTYTSTLSATTIKPKNDFGVSQLDVDARPLSEL